eukprot:CAMPEP_0198351374 /NCGR_PEP_ID=MMETSP1450-20131203/102584_1 /TAXON_ID=753684 ORGANISM="Madagascaria erythrocladiodes, Strain CCMP3234" /NCGR_SAMPLE_ID=MMETSP1450 /ASSEMBLY_ACC=CAM_ASM_001115 /LENGTH=94 /DNA_ID=CAMNT_0044057287 /DNA_START=36 /DNA_END=317 /DNA_ORIENTATION=+
MLIVNNEVISAMCGKLVANFHFLCIQAPHGEPGEPPVPDEADFASVVGQLDVRYRRALAWPTDAEVLGCVNVLRVEDAAFVYEIELRKVDDGTV